MYICDNPACKVWFHENHLIDDYLIKTYKRVVSEGTNGVAKSTNKKAKTPIYKGTLKATIQEDSDGIPRVAVTDLRPGADPETWKERILCPKCETPFE